VFFKGHFVLLCQMDTRIGIYAKPKQYNQGCHRSGLKNKDNQKTRKTHII